MFENDICYCINNQNCPLKDYCRRAQKLPKGIYTVSSFYDNNTYKCKHFLPIKIDKWIGTELNPICGMCGCDIMDTYIIGAEADIAKLMPYCPHCGHKMRNGEDD